MENKRDLLEQKGHIMKKTISGIMCGIIATGQLRDLCGSVELYQQLAPKPDEAPAPKTL